jgi:hypothetical protein
MFKISPVISPKAIKAIMPPKAVKAIMAIILPSPLVFLLSAGQTEALLILAHGRRRDGS